MKILFGPIPAGTHWEVLLTRETTTYYQVTIDHADLGHTDDPEDCTRLQEKIKASALRHLGHGNAIIIGVDRPPVEMWHWAVEGSAAARQAMDHYASMISDPGIRPVHI